MPTRRAPLVPKRSSTLDSNQLDDVAAAIVGVDTSGNVVLWNQAAEVLFGWRAEEVLGQPPPIVPDALQQEWRLQMRQVLDGGRGSGAAETQRLDRSGRVVPVLRSSAPLHTAHAVGEAGEIVGVLDTLVDITALKQLGSESRALSQVRERELIAMDLHDGIVQSLYALSLNLAAQERSPEFDVAGARAALQRARLDIEHVIAEARAYLVDLGAREFAPRDLVSGLQLLVDALRLNSRIEPHLALDPSINDVLEPEVRGHLLYVAHEAVANILRHAGASAVAISLEVTARVVRLLIVDNGRGYVHTARPRRSQRGLRNMASRARLIGGKLAVRSAPGEGTRISLELPRPPRRRAIEAD